MGEWDQKLQRTHLERGNNLLQVRVLFLFFVFLSDISGKQSNLRFVFSLPPLEGARLNQRTRGNPLELLDLHRGRETKNIIIYDRDTKTRKLRTLETPNCAFFYCCEFGVLWGKKQQQSRLFLVGQETTIPRDIKTGIGAMTKRPQTFVLIIIQMKSIDMKYIAKRRKL